jgi:ADP-ribose pyrophosphatase YjhB (NUDIX family)
MSFDWLGAAQRLRAMAQTGLEYSENRFDIERYRELERLSHSMLAELLSSTPAGITELYALEKGYPTPKVDVRTATFSDGRILLVKEWLDGKWTLPGGWADESDSPSEAAERECREESGFEVKIARLVALRDRRRHGYWPRHLGGIYKLIFLADLTGGAATVSHETTEVGFFALNELPPLSLGRTLPEEIALAYRHELDRTLLPTLD